MLKGDTDPEKRPVSSARLSDHEKRPIWNIVEENNHRQNDKENNGLQTNVFFFLADKSRQDRHRSTPSVTRHTYTHPK